MLERTNMKQVLVNGDHLMKWQVGERVVYPSHGVGEIVSIEANDLFGPGVEVYVLELMQSNRRRVMISIEKAE